MFLIKKYFLIPGNLSIVESLNEIGESCSKIEEDKFYYVIDKIYHNTVINKRAYGDYTILNIKILQRVLGTRFATKITNLLLKLNIIETDNMYIVGKKSKGYRMTKQYRTKFKKVDFNNLNFQQKLARLKAEDLSFICANPILEYILQCCMQCKFDLNSAIRYTLSIYDKFIDEGKILCREGWAGVIESGEQHCAQDKQGRFYNNMSLMPKDIRRFASIDGQPIWQCDYSACQPTLLAYWYDDENPAHVEERNRYLEIINSGIYQYLADRYSIKYDLNNPKEKAAFKELLFKHYLFCRNVINTEMARLFKKEFPILASIIFEMKKSDHSTLATNLQALEAHIILNIVAPKLIEQKVWFVTIHDCIATKLETLDIVAREMSDGFEYVAGFSIKVKKNLVGN